MDKYTLYLDESETFTSAGDRYFAVGGVVVLNTSLPQIAASLDSLKNQLWSGDANATTYILHEKEITEMIRYGKAKQIYNRIFRIRQNVRKLYAGLSSILKTHSITTMGVCIDESLLQQLYPGETNPNLTIALQLLLENYCHFLQTHNAEGDVCYESLQDPGNAELSQRFYELKALGTLYYTPHFFQTHIGEIKFVDKNRNLPGLQLADFIPNTYARVCSGANAKHEIFKKTVLKLAYDGGLAKSSKYGLKRIP